MREFACRILLDVQHAGRGAADSIATRIPPSPSRWIGACRVPGLGQIDMTAAEDINRESLGSLHECFPDLESSERHLGAAREPQKSPGALFSSSWTSLEGLSRNLGGPSETLRQPLAVFWWLLAALGEKNVKKLKQKGI